MAEQDRNHLAPLSEDEAWQIRVREQPMTVRPASHDADFWARCVESQCVVVPVRAFTGYGPDGNTHAEQFMGIRYVALSFQDQAVGPDYYVSLEESECGRHKLFETPELALANFRRGGNRQVAQE